MPPITARESSATGERKEIDIGRSSRTVPVTPPYVRVRIRRFGRLSTIGRKARQPQSIEVTVREGHTECEGLTEAPWTEA